MRIDGQRATRAVGGSTAMGLAHGDREGMKLVEEARLVSGGIGGEGLAGEIGQGIVSRAIAAGSGRQKPVALRDAAQVLVGDGNGMAECVEQDGVGGLRSNAGKGQQTGAQCGRGRGGEILERTAEFLVEHGYKFLERGRFASVKAGGLDEALQLPEGERTQAVHGQRARLAQVSERSLDGLPGCVLGEVSAEDNFKRSFGRPPVLGTVGLEKSVVHPAEALDGGGLGGGHGWF